MRRAKEKRQNATIVHTVIIVSSSLFSKYVVRIFHVPFKIVPHQSSEFLSWKFKPHDVLRLCCVSDIVIISYEKLVNFILLIEYGTLS